jgi:hypothetical protein
MGTDEQIVQDRIERQTFMRDTKEIDMNTQGKTNRCVLISCAFLIYLQAGVASANLGQTLYLSEGAIPATPNLELQLQLARDDYGNDPEEATCIPTISRFVGAFEAEGDIDWFEIEVPVDGILSVSVFSDAAVELSIRDADQQEVAWAASGGSANELSIAEYLTAGTYYIEISEVAHAQDNAYGVSIRFGPDGGDVGLLAVAIYGSIQGKQGAISPLSEETITRQHVHDIVVDFIDPNSLLMMGTIILADPFLVNPDILIGELDRLMMDWGAFLQATKANGGMPGWLDACCSAPMGESETDDEDEELEVELFFAPEETGSVPRGEWVSYGSDGFYGGGSGGPIYWLGPYAVLSKTTGVTVESVTNEVLLGILEDYGAADAPLSVIVQTPMDDNAFTQPDSGSYLLRP